GDGKEPKEARDGSTRRKVVVEMPLNDPDGVINWRNTEVGRAEENRLKNTLKRGGKLEADDVGHLIALSHGADPAQRENVGWQNFQQNQGGGTYHDFENRYRQLARDNPGEEYRLLVTETYNRDKYGNDRSYHRNLKVVDSSGEVVKVRGPDGKVT